MAPSSESVEVLNGETRIRIEQLIQKIEAKFEGYKYTGGSRGSATLADIKNRLFRITIHNLNFVLGMLGKPVKDRPINCRFDAGKVIQDAMDFFETVEDLTLEDHSAGDKVFAIIPDSFKHLKKKEPNKTTNGTKLIEYFLFLKPEDYSFKRLKKMQHINIQIDWEILEYFLDKKLENFGLSVEERNAVGNANEIFEYFLDKKREEFGLSVEKHNGAGKAKDDFEAMINKYRDEYFSEFIMENDSFESDDQCLEYLLRNSDI